MAWCNCGGGVAYLPIALVLISFITFMTTYIIAVGEDHVSAYFPYISDTGTKVPESCIFGQFLNIAAAFAFCTIYVRYKLVESISGHEDKHIRRMNKVGLLFGSLSALGLSMVANFQETSVEAVHVTGAALVFGLGVVYSFLQTFLTYQMYPDFNGLLVARVRLAMSVLSLISMLIAFITAGYSRYVKTNQTDKFHWTSDEKGFAAHIVSTMTEWVTAIVFLGFFFTYIRDFQKVKIEVHARMRVRHLDEEPLFDSHSERSPLLS